MFATIKYWTWYSGPHFRPEIALEVFFSHVLYRIQSSNLIDTAKANASRKLDSVIDRHLAHFTHSNPMAGDAAKAEVVNKVTNLVDGMELTLARYEDLFKVAERNSQAYNQLASAYSELRGNFQAVASGFQNQNFNHAFSVQPRPNNFQLPNSFQQPAITAPQYHCNQPTNNAAQAPMVNPSFELMDISRFKP